MVTYMCNGIFAVTVPQVTGLYHRLQRHTLTRVRKERNDTCLSLA